MAFRTIEQGTEATAHVFLSYAREDAKKAKRLADALTVAGHSVWWDFQIEGGARFGDAIDAALRDADAVVVLWSGASIDSSWVRDEAAAGRDSGRLVPLLIEPVDPPLGFRQYQCISLVDWSGRRTPRQLPRMLSKIATLDAQAPQSDARPPPTRAPFASYRRHLRAVVVALALILAAGAFFLWLRTSGATATPSVIVATSSSAPAQPSNEFAHSVALDLGRFQEGPLSGLSISQADQGGPRDADYRIEVGLAPGSGGPHADAAMLDRQHTVLWTTGVDTPAGRLVDLRQQVSAQIGSVLSCAVRVPAMRPRPAGEVLKLYLTGCARLYGGQPDDTTYSIFRRITEKQPNLAEGWAGMAQLEASSIGNSDPNLSALMKMANEHLQRARQLNPHLDLVYAAESLLHPINDRNWGLALDSLARGIKDNPDSALLYSEQSIALQHVGRMQDGVDSAHSAVQLNPLSAGANSAYISALAYSGNEPAAERELDQAERIWPGSAVIEEVRYRFDFRYGDAANAERLLKERRDIIGAQESPAVDAFMAARISPTQANKDKAIAAYEAVYRRDPSRILGLLQALGTFGRVDDAFTALQTAPAIDALYGYGTDVLFRPDMHSIRADPRFMAFAARLGLIRLWRQTGIWPDFCQDPQLPYDCQKEAAKFTR